MEVKDMPTVIEDDFEDGPTSSEVDYADMDRFAIVSLAANGDKGAVDFLNAHADDDDDDQ